MQDAGRTASQLRQDIADLMKAQHAVSGAQPVDAAAAPPPVAAAAAAQPPPIYEDDEAELAAQSGLGVPQAEVTAAVERLLQQMEGAGLTEDVLTASKMQAEQLQAQAQTVRACSVLRMELVLKRLQY